MIEIDGSYLEGGGQIVRTALALSAFTGKAFRAEKIRKGRDKPGLKSQHLFALKTLAELSNAHADGGELGSTSLEFIPRKLEPKSITCDIETAGSITLYLQAVMLPMLFGKSSNVIRVKGGTDVKWSPSIDYFTNVLVPQLRRYAEIDVELHKRGYYPAGCGEVKVRIKPRHSIEEISLMKNNPLLLQKQGKLVHIAGVSHASKDLMKQDVAERQAKAARFILGQLDVGVKIDIEYCDTLSTGSGITLWAFFSDTDETVVRNPVILGADSLGKKGKRAEIVGQDAAKELLSAINSGSAVDIHMADQILPYMALSGGELKAGALSKHARANIYVIEKFFPRRIEVNDGVVVVRDN